MGHRRPRCTNSPTHATYTGYPCPCGTWRMLKLFVAALVVVAPTGVAGFRRHSRERAWPGVANNLFTSGFVSSALSPAASRASFRSRKHLLFAWIDFCCTIPSSGDEHHAATRSSGGGWWANMGFDRGHSSNSCSRWRNGQHHDRARLEAATRRRISPQPVYAVNVGVNESSSSPAEVRQSVEGREATVILTTTGGRPHTAESKAKISAANKGKAPWNKGGRHSEETRRKIAEGARKNALKRKEATAQSLGMTLSEYAEMKQRQLSAGEHPPEVSEETRLKISMRLKERWKDPQYRERRKSCMPNRLGVAHSDATKARIAAAVKERWKDPAYREKIASRIPSEETRAKIGQIIRDQWADPEIRKERMAKMRPKSEEHKKRISEGVKSKWADPEFRRRTRDKMSEAARARVVAAGGSPRQKSREGNPAVRKARRISALARSQENNRIKWERLSRKVELKMSRESKKQEKLAQAAARQAEREAKEEAARRAQEEEDELVAGLDELEMVLMRQQLRAKKLARLEKEAQAAKRAREDGKTRRAAFEAEVEASAQAKIVANVPDGFEMVEVNGRKILRMK